MEEKYKGERLHTRIVNRHQSHSLACGGFNRLSFECILMENVPSVSLLSLRGPSYISLSSLTFGGRYIYKPCSIESDVRDR